MAIRTDISKYEFANGRKPKGFGYWAFEVTGYDENRNMKTATAWETGTYAEAKKKAIASFRRSYSKVVFSVTVLP